MLPGFLLALREGIEVALVLGILFSGLRKLQRADLSLSIWLGVFAAVVTSVLFALGLQLAGANLEGPVEPIFEGTTLLFAAILLTWMIFWMQRQSRHLRGRIEENIRRAAGSSGRWSLFGVAFFSVLRDGSELALFITALDFSVNRGQTLLGAVLGLIAAGFAGWVLFNSTRRLPLQRFFQVTNILLILFAAGLVAHGVHEFVEVGWIPALVDPVYNLNFMVSSNSGLGQLLEAVFGYNGSPSLAESAAYLVYFLILVLALVFFQRRPVGKPA
jgi:high-affinity iron transporter